MTATATSRRTEWLRRLTVAALLATYTALCFRAAASPNPDAIDALVALAPFIALGWLSARRAVGRLRAMLLFAAGIMLLGWNLPVLAQHAGWLLLVQHASIYLALSWTFGSTLVAHRLPLVSKFAAWGRVGELPPRVARYTRRVTAAWALMFGSIAATSAVLFVVATPTAWALFINLASPLLVAAMFLLEYAVRCMVIPRSERTGAKEAIRACRAAWAAHQAPRA